VSDSDEIACCRCINRAVDEFTRVVPLAAWERESIFCPFPLIQAEAYCRRKLAHSLAAPEFVLIPVGTETIAESANVSVIVPTVIGCEALGSITLISELSISILGETTLEPLLSVCVV
jgi:hypothetical protein